jgi:hypothetical protein
VGNLHEQITAILIVLHLVGRETFAEIPLLKEGVQVDVAIVGDVIFEIEACCSAVCVSDLEIFQRAKE